MKKIIFFNQFHNGDCFVGKGYVADMMRQLPDVEFAYAHNNHPDIIRDLGIEHLSLNNIPPMDRMTRVAESPDKDIVFVNTWVGCWQGTMFPFGEHINFVRLHNIWREYFKYFNLEFREDTDYYLPNIDFTKFDTQAAYDFGQKTRNFILVCNGSANSGQSRVGNLRHTVDLLLQRLPDHKIVCTERLDLVHERLIYTDDLFVHLESDINQIAYISQWADLIVGKNSGPFSYCQFKDNLLVNAVSFLNLSILPTDCPSGGSVYPARCLFSAETNEEKIANIIENIILKPELRGTEIII